VNDRNPGAFSRTGDPSSRFATRGDYYDWNEEMIRRYDPAKYYRFSIIKVLEQARFRHIVGVLRRSARGGRFLEIGCGHGFFLAEAVRSGLFTSFVGADISMASLTEARQRAGGASLVQADGEYLGFRGGTFDAVCLTEVIEHVPDQVAVLKEASRMLAPGGILVVTAPNERLINQMKTVVYGLRLDRLLFWSYKPSQRMDEEWHLHAMNRVGLRRVVQEAGLKPLRWIHLPYRFLPMRNLVVCAVASEGASG
jgi:ubiquinone/menaquinone biosynthesis C-methylase UbiE